MRIFLLSVVVLFLAGCPPQSSGRTADASLSDASLVDDPDAFIDVALDASVPDAFRDAGRRSLGDGSLDAARDATTRIDMSTRADASVGPCGDELSQEVRGVAALTHVGVDSGGHDVIASFGETTHELIIHYFRDGAYVDAIVNVFEEVESPGPVSGSSSYSHTHPLETIKLVRADGLPIWIVRGYQNLYGTSRYGRPVVLLRPTATGYQSIELANMSGIPYDAVRPGPRGDLYCFGASSPQDTDLADTLISAYLPADGSIVVAHTIFWGGDEEYYPTSIENVVSRVDVDGAHTWHSAFGTHTYSSTPHVFGCEGELRLTQIEFDTLLCDWRVGDTRTYTLDVDSFVSVSP